MIDHFQLGGKTIEPIYYHYTPTERFLYCSLNIICRIDDQYHDLMIKDITFDYLRTHYEAGEEYKQIISNNKDKVYITVPQYFALKLVRTTKPNFVRIDMPELAIDYWANIEPALRANRQIDPSIIISFLAASNEINQITKQSILFDYYLAGDTVNSDHFVIRDKKMFQNPTGLYVLWYRPQIRIKELTTLLVGLTKPGEISWCVNREVFSGRIKVVRSTPS